jgi:hypothetical protein
MADQSKPQPPASTPSLPGSVETEPPTISEELRHDAVARWFLENLGHLPTPELRRDFQKRIEKELSWDEDKWLGDSLIKSDPDSGIEPYDFDEDVRLAASVGVDLTADPDFQRLKRLADEAWKRRAARARRTRDPKAKERALSFKKEREAERERRRKEVEKKGPPSSRKSRPHWRRDQKRDRAILSDIKRFLDAGIGVRLAPSKPVLVRLQKEIAEASKGRADHPDPIIIVPHWEKATLRLRMFGMSVAAGKRGGRDFTLHLNEEVMDYALGGDGKSFAKRMHRRLKDALASAYGAAGLATPDFFFQVERGRGEAPHIHGVILVPDGSSLTLLRDALRRAGGEPWKRARHISTQVDIGELSEPVGWVGYISKFAEITQEAIGDNTFAATFGMRAIGKGWYQKARMRGELLLPGKATPI